MGLARLAYHAPRFAFLHAPVARVGIDARERPPKAVILFTVAGLAMAIAGIRAAKAEPAHAPVAAHSGGVWMVISHRVYDYNRWKRVHDETASTKRNYGWKDCSVFAVDGDRNHVMVMERFGSLERAQAFARSTELRDEMAASGVSSQPEIHFVNALAGEPQP